MLQIFISILLIVFILLQGGGAGLSSTFGGFGNYYSTKRGVDKYVFYITIILSVTFAVSAVILLLI